jgi:cation diffusion facilitator CzcD-associated flavoprotein CzcO
MQADMADVDAASRHAHDAIIIGAGFAGIGMAVALRKRGIEDFVILEKAQEVGGVWRDNSYPGAACDVPSRLYSFSFHPNPDWSRRFAPQSEIFAYLGDCAAHFDLRRHIRFGAEVRSAAYDDVSSRWQVTLADGSVLQSRFVVTAMGQLSRPALPDIPGRESFQGKTFHSADWDHNFDLGGKRVAVIGTGASAIQFVPAIAERVGEMTVFQRSPAYILPRPDRAYTRLERLLCRRAPWSMRLQRLAIYLRYESRAVAFTRLKGLMIPMAERPFLRLLARQVSSAELRKKMTPGYPAGCKRILLSSEYLAAFDRPNVKLETDGIRRITPTGVETESGRYHEVDVIICGTGFAAQEFLAPVTIKGRSGKRLRDVWSTGAKAYLGIMVPEFPNLFMLYGPNTNLGHNSIVYMLESQIAHVIRCLKKMDRSKATHIEVAAEAHQRFADRVQARLARTVWVGCRSWYVDEHGHNSANWPGFTLTYRWLARLGSLDAYRLTRET